MPTRSGGAFGTHDWTVGLRPTGVGGSSAQDRVRVLAPRMPDYVALIGTMEAVPGQKLVQGDTSVSQRPHVIGQFGFDHPAVPGQQRRHQITTTRFDGDRFDLCAKHIEDEPSTDMYPQRR